MIRINGVIGNINEDETLATAIQEHRKQGTLEVIRIDGGDRQRSRMRVQTDQGTDIGLIIEEPPLVEGDVLHQTDERAIIVAFEERDALAVELPDEFPVNRAVKLGHRIGNQHWDIAIIESTLYIPLDARQQIVEDVLQDHLPTDTTYERTTVDATRFHDDGRPTPGHGADTHSHRLSESNPHSHSEADE